MSGESGTIEVLLLTQAHCGFCEQAEALLERLRHEYPLSITHLDLASPEGEALAMRHHVLFAPGILLDGAFFSYGRPSERRLRQELDRRCARGEWAPHP